MRWGGYEVAGVRRVLVGRGIFVDTQDDGSIPEQLLLCMEIYNQNPLVVGENTCILSEFVVECSHNGAVVRRCFSSVRRLHLIRRYALGYLLLRGASRGGALLFLLMTQALLLPASTVGGCLLFVFGVLIIAGRALLHKGRGRDIFFGYLLDMVSVVFCLLTAGHGSPVAISVLEMVAIGTVVDLLIDGAILVSLVRSDRYVEIHQR